MESNISSAKSAHTNSIEFEIDAILNRLEDQARSETNQAAFYDQVAKQARTAVSAIAVVIWKTGPQQSLQLVRQDGVAGVFGIDSQRYLDRERKRLQFNFEQVVDVPTSNERRHFVVSSHFAERNRGIVSFYLPADLPASAHEGYLEFANAIAEILSDFEDEQDRRNQRQLHSDWNRYQQFSLAFHRDWKLNEVAYKIANDGRSYLDCDRISVAIRKGRNYRLIAVSGVDLVDRRSELAHAMEELVRRIALTQETFFVGDMANKGEYEPQIERSLNQFLDVAATKRLLMIPLSNATRHRDNEIDAPSHDSELTFGALVIEWFQSEAMHDILGKSAAITEHAQLALGRAYQVQQIPFFRLALAFRPMWSWFSRRAIPRWIAAALVIAAITLTLFFVKVDHHVAARGELLPVQAKKIFASEDGMVQKVFVQDEQSVRKDQPLLQLESKELNLELQRISGELSTARKQLMAIDAKRLTTHGTDQSTLQRAEQLSADEMAVKENIANLEKQLAIVRQQEKGLLLCSPIAGQVLGWDMQNQLQGRPVQRGQFLFDVCNLSDRWIVRLEVPDHRIGPILEWQANHEEALFLEFKLVNEPDSIFLATVQRIDLATQSRDASSAFVRVEAAIDDKLPGQLRPGSTVVGKLTLGRKPIAYVWTHEFFEELKRRFF